MSTKSIQNLIDDLKTYVFTLIMFFYTSYWFLFGNPTLDYLIKHYGPWGCTGVVILSLLILMFFYFILIPKRK